MGDLALEDVYKVFRDGTEAVADLNLYVEDGSFFVLLGPSGSGKTTVLRLVAGLEHPTEGRVLIGGRDVTELSPRSRDVAMVFQHYAVYPHMTVYDNIAFGVRVRHLDKEEVDRRVRGAATMLGLEDVLKKKPGSLSGGQLQRVALGRALVREPQAFLMDEPMSNVDTRFRAQLRGELARIQRDVAVTTLYVTHDQAEAMTLGDHVGVLRDGVLQQVDTPKGLYDRPRNLFVAGFVGSPPMNLAEATVDEDDSGMVLIFGGHRVRIDGETLGRRPGLRTYARKQVVIGIRPEDVTDEVTAAVPEAARMRVAVARCETVGPDTYTQFVIDAPLLLAEDPREAVDDVDADDDATPWPAERVNLWMARTSSPAPSPGDAIELTFRPGRLYAFDPRTGDAIEG
jgi:multiple sugar transport system ATP-binding protein